MGLGKKVLLSNQLAVVADAAFGRRPLLSAAYGLAGRRPCYTLQLYYDFSGYSDMAIGLGKMFGFHFLMRTSTSPTCVPLASPTSGAAGTFP